MPDYHVEIEEFVTDDQTGYEQAVADGDYDDLGRALATSQNNARWVALGMVYLAKTEDAKRWCTSLAPVYVDEVRWQLEEGDGPTAIVTDTRRVSIDLYHGLQMAVLSADEEVLATTVADVRQLLDRPELRNIHRKPLFAGLVRALTALLVEEDDVAAAIENLREGIDASDRADDEQLFGSHATAIEGLHREDPVLVEVGIDGLLARHDERMAGDEFHVVEQKINAHACMYVVLAHRRSLDVRVDSEYVPETVYELV